MRPRGPSVRAIAAACRRESTSFTTLLPRAHQRALIEARRPSTSTGPHEECQPPARTRPVPPTNPRRSDEKMARGLAAPRCRIRKTSAGLREHLLKKTHWRVRPTGV
jgi:hypothetical protein